MMKRLVSPRPGRQPHAAGDHGRALVAEGDHVLAEDAGAGAGAADGHAAGVARADQLGDRRAAEERREPQLVAAGEEDAAWPPRGARRRPASWQSRRVSKSMTVDARGADVAEQLLVAGARSRACGSRWGSRRCRRRSPPETRTKRSRMRRSFSLFSAPPIGTIQPRVSPSGTLLGILQQTPQPHTVTQKVPRRRGGPAAGRCRSRDAGAPADGASRPDRGAQGQRPFERAHLAARKPGDPQLEVGVALLDAQRGAKGRHADEVGVIADTARRRLW